jgi:hypothetical protein
MPPKIESGQTAFSSGDSEAPGSSADVPQLPKPIRCAARPQCESARQGLGCDHAMSRQELVEWLDRIRNHRISIESGPRATRSTSGPKAAAKPQFREI